MLQERMAANRWYTSTVQALLAETTRNRPDKTALVFNEREITYGELQENTNRVSQALLNLGVKPGDHVATLPLAIPEFAYVYFAALQIGAVINPLNLLWGEIEFTGILQRNDPKVIVTIDQMGPKNFIELLGTCLGGFQVREDGSGSCEHVPTLTHLVSLSLSGQKYDGFMDFGEWVAGGLNYDADRIAGLISDAKPTDIQFICQTSGSTGLSKSGLWNHRAPLSTAHFMAKFLNYREDDSYINLAPFFHNSGMGSLNMTLAYTGSTLYLTGAFDPKKAMELIDKHDITGTTGFDAHYQALNMVRLATGLQFKLSKCLVAIAPKTYDLLVHEMSVKENAHFAGLFAQTEAGGLMALMESDCMIHDLKKFNNGRPLPGVEVTIKDINTGERIPPWEQGEICYKSPFMFSGYYKQEDEYQRCLDDEGFFHSGDFGTFNHGYVQFLGRLGGVVKSGGENVSTTYVSTLLLELFGHEFEDVQTIGIPDPYWGAKVVTWVRMREGRVLKSREEIRAACKGKMAEYEIPKAFLEWEGPWPMTVVGKIQQDVLENSAIQALEEKGK